MELNGEMSVQSMRKIGEHFDPKFLQPFRESIERRSCNDGSQELIPVFHNPHRNVVSKLGVLCRRAPLGRVEREKKCGSISKRPVRTVQRFRRRYL